MEEIKIYEADIGGVKEWVAATNIQDAKSIVLENCDEDEIVSIHALSDEAMDTLQHHGEDGDASESPVSFRERLNQYINEGVRFPAHFASTEW